MNQNRWIRIGFFYLVAMTVSVLARRYWHTGDAATTMRSAGSLYYHLVGGMGPALGAAVIFLAFRYRSRITFAGTNLGLGLAMMAAPAAVMAVMGVPNPFGIEPHLFGIHLGLLVALYALLEEIGWRGYLQNELGDQPALLKYAIVGVFWYAWHLSWLESASVAREIPGFVMIILSSMGIGFVADRTHSIFAAAAFHTIGDVMGLMRDFSTIIPDNHVRLTVVAACVIIWLVLLKIWRMRDNAKAAG